jgi:uncharacterized protein with HEPN domain
MGLRGAHPQVPWQDIIGLRSVVTHGYDEIDQNQLWHVIERDLPELISKLQAILSTLQ